MCVRARACVCDSDSPRQFEGGGGAAGRVYVLKVYYFKIEIIKVCYFKIERGERERETERQRERQTERERERQRGSPAEASRRRGEATGREGASWAHAA